MLQMLFAFAKHFAPQSYSALDNDSLQTAAGSATWEVLLTDGETDIPSEDKTNDKFLVISISN